MARVRYTWNLLDRLHSNDELNDYVEDEMCCSKITHTDRAKTCRVCSTDISQPPHTMEERRVVCKSPTCVSVGPCRFALKLWYCPTTQRTDVLHNGIDHSRSDMECTGEHRVAITKQMKQFILQQDDCGLTPRMILSYMMRSPDIREPARGYPTMTQVANCAKNLRRQQGAKNAVWAIRELVRKHAYRPEAFEEAFIFGASEDDGGYPYVGAGSDDDPFVLGVTSKALIEASLRFARPHGFSIFHADATFKLSDLGYPCITCGFTDARRVYQLSALFIVSRRTEAEYSKCLRALVKIIGICYPTAPFVIKAVMGDAEAAQYNAFASTPEFANAAYLMCFFHVLYNTRKRTRHLAPSLKHQVMSDIMALHYATDSTVYYTRRGAIVASWMETPGLREFAEYFSEHWLFGRFSRWQCFHTPVGYATTNNPCETFNAVLKTYTGRRRHCMQQLLTISRVVVNEYPTLKPLEDHEPLPPNRETVRAGRAMIKKGCVSVFSTDQANFCRVKESPADREEDYRALDQVFSDANEHGYLEDSNNDERDMILGPALLLREERERANRLYTKIWNWSLRSAHLSGMPSEGWIVDVQNCVCPCQFYKKFKSCAHIVVARTAKRMPLPGIIDKTTKLVNRQRAKVSRSATVCRSSRVPMHESAPSQSSGSIPIASQSLDPTSESWRDSPPFQAPTSSWCDQLLEDDFAIDALDIYSLGEFDSADNDLVAQLNDNRGRFGRPPKASKAMDIQFILC